MNHQNELKELSPLLHELHQKTLTQQKLPSNTWFDDLHQQTLRKITPNKSKGYFYYTMRIAALLAGAFLTYIIWNQQDSIGIEWEESLTTIPTEDLAIYIENHTTISVFDSDENIIAQELQAELFESLSAEELEPILSYMLIQMNEIELYNTLNSNL